MAASFKERKPIQIDEEYPDYGEEVLNRLVGPTASAKLPQVSQLSRPQPEIVRTTSQKNQGSTLSTIAKRACRDSIRIAVFILLLMVLYNWNVKLFKLGDTQKVISQDEKCTTINRFDFTSKSWNEELTLNNLGNVYHQKQICDNYKSEFSQLMRNGVLKAAKGIKKILGDEED